MCYTSEGKKCLQITASHHQVQNYVVGIIYSYKNRLKILYRNYVKVKSKSTGITGVLRSIGDMADGIIHKRVPNTGSIKHNQLPNGEKKKMSKMIKDKRKGKKEKGRKINIKQHAETG